MNIVTTSDDRTIFQLVKYMTRAKGICLLHQNIATLENVLLVFLTSCKRKNKCAIWFDYG